VAIEPGYANFASLCDNILLNGLAESVMPFPVALADRTHLGSLSYRSTSAGAAIHALDADQDGVYRQPILVYALDDLVERFSLPAPTLIKLDVDGGESAVLDGAPRILADPRLRSVIAEIEIAQTDAVTSTLAGFGLELAARFNDRHGEPLPGLWYGVFTRPE
jgi:FkbM family methyltransferase